MGSFTHPEGKGSLFHERDKTNERAPDLKGKGTINGETVFISAWKSDRFDGVSLSFETQAQRDERLGGSPEDRARQAPGDSGPPPPDDDIPF